jgi:hypothetical protein
MSKKRVLKFNRGGDSVEAQGGDRRASAAFAIRLG